MFIIATLAPILGVLWPSLAVACGAVAGLWIFLGRTYLVRLQSTDINRGAAVQEQFDSAVFAMNLAESREGSPSMEDVEKMAGSDDSVRKQVREQKLLDWYEFDENAQQAKAVAVAQRANVSYSDSLLRATAKVWWGGVIVWAFVAISLSLILSVEFSTILFIVVLPLLPAFLDVMEFSSSYTSASHVRRQTADEIEAAIKGGDLVTPGQLLVWQERIYQLRRTTPLVPDRIYWLQRKKNEFAMKAAAKRLSQ